MDSAEWVLAVIPAGEWDKRVSDRSEEKYEVLPKRIQPPGNYH